MSEWVTLVTGAGSGVSRLHGQPAPDAHVLSMTVMASGMPFVGRG